MPEPKDDQAPRCMTSGCHGKVYCRRLCKACYQCIWKRYVKSGTLTWDQVEEAGYCGPIRGLRIDIPIPPPPPDEPLVQSA